MVELIIGVVFTAMASISLFITGGQLLNGELDLMTFLIAGSVLVLFIVVGIVMLIKGIKKLISNITTELNGTEAYGIVANVYPSGARVNNRPLFIADVVYVDKSGDIKICSENIGFSMYDIGEFVLIKHFQNDINIKEAISASNIPSQILEKLEGPDGFLMYAPEGTAYHRMQQTDREFESFENSYDDNDVIVIDGKLYKRIG